jgi:hypothetical protein
MLTAHELVQRYVAALRGGTVKTTRSNGPSFVPACVAERFAARYGR